ncbi:MAG: hypothetical protein MHMPM18_001960 [Marteilia pararefringens]
MRAIIAVLIVSLRTVSTTLDTRNEENRPSSSLPGNAGLQDSLGYYRCIAGIMDKISICQSNYLSESLSCIATPGMMNDICRANVFFEYTSNCEEDDGIILTLPQALMTYDLYRCHLDQSQDDQCNALLGLLKTQVSC